MAKIGEFSVVIKPEFQATKLEQQTKKAMAFMNATKGGAQKKELKEREKANKAFTQKRIKENAKYQKEILKIQLAYMKQGLSEVESAAKAKEEAELNEFQKALKQRDRALKAFRDKQAKADLAAQKKAERNSFKARAKRFAGQVGTIAAGTAAGNWISGAGRKGLSFASSFTDAMQELEVRESLTKRFGEENKNELLKQFNAITIQTGENFESLAGTFASINTQLGDVIGPKRQKAIFKSLTKFGDSFSSVADLANEYASAVESGGLAEGSELAKILGGRRRARRFNQFTEQQNVLVEAGFARDLGDESLIKSREKFLARDLASAKGATYKPNELTDFARRTSRASAESEIQTLISTRNLANTAGLNYSSGSESQKEFIAATASSIQKALENPIREVASKAIQGIDKITNNMPFWLKKAFGIK